MQEIALTGRQSDETTRYSSHLDVLSTELLIEILGWLPYLQLVICRRVCRRIQLTIDSTTSLQLRIELGAAGYRDWDTKQNSVNELERFGHLQRLYRNPRYRKLDFTSEVELLRLFSQANPDGHRGQWRHFGDFLVGTRYPDSVSGTISQFDFLFLGSSDRSNGGEGGAYERYWTICIDGFWDISAIEPTRDLLLLTQGQVLRFSSLRSGQPHNGASLRELAIPEHALILDLRGSWLLLSWLYVSPDIYLYHWPSGSRTQAWTYEGEGRFISARGCFADGYLIVPALGTGTSQPPHFVSINVYALPVDEANKFDIPPAVLVASYELPHTIHRVALESDHQRGRRRTSCALLSLRLGDRHFYVPTSVLIPESIMFTRPDTTTQITPTPWSTWAPESLHPANDEHLRFVATAGLHIIYEQTILDFNQYDAARNIYGPDKNIRNAPLSIVRTGPALVASTQPDEEITGTLMQTPWWCAGLRMNGPRYRQTMCSFEYIAPDSGRWYFIEEEDGPKLVRVIWTQDAIPLRLHFYSF